MFRVTGWFGEHKVDLTIEDLGDIVRDQLLRDESEEISVEYKDLDERAQKMYAMRMDKLMSNREIGDVFGVSHATVSNAIRNYARENGLDPGFPARPDLSEPEPEKRSRFNPRMR